MRVPPRPVRRPGTFAGARWWTDPGIAGALLALLLHASSLGHGFVRDDAQLIAGNAVLQGSGSLWTLLTRDYLASTGYVSGMWRPLPLLSFWVEGRLSGWNPWLFHGTSILLYAACVFVLARLLAQARIPRVAALLAVLWFAAMPAHLEAVAWISGRTDLLCGFFALLALWLDRRDRDAGRRWPGWGALAAFAAALLSKEAAAGWLAVLAAAEGVRSREHPGGIRAAAVWLVPYAALTAAWLLAHQAASGAGVLPAYVDDQLRARRMAAGWIMLPRYLSFLWPGFPHASDVPVPLPVGPGDPMVLAVAMATIAAFVGGVVLALRRFPVSVPVAILLVPVLPPIVLALVRGFVSSGERLMFLPSAGAAWLLAAALGSLWRRGATARRVGGALAAGLILASASETVRLQPSWASDERLFEAMTRRQPLDPAGWVGLGETLMQAGRATEAEAALDRAAELNPRLPSVHAARAELHYLGGNWDLVLADAGRALELDPRLSRPRLLRASTLVRLGRPGDAGPDLDWLLRERPGDLDVLGVEGQRRLAEGRPDQAVGPLQEVAAGRPGDPTVWSTLAQARASAGDLPGARMALERAVRLAPQAGVLWRRLASVCAALGDSGSARAALERSRPAAP